MRIQEFEIEILREMILQLTGKSIENDTNVGEILDSLDRLELIERIENLTGGNLDELYVEPSHWVELNSLLIYINRVLNDS
jgi:hypothetical protein